MTIYLCLRYNHIILFDQAIVHLKFLYTCFNVWLFSFCIHINHNYYYINILNLSSTDYDSKSAFYWIKSVCYFPLYLFWILVVVMSLFCYIHIANYTSVQTMYWYDCTQFGATCCPLYELRSIIVNKLLNGVPGPDFPTPPPVPIKGHSVETGLHSVDDSGNTWRGDFRLQLHDRSLLRYPERHIPLHWARQLSILPVKPSPEI